MITAGMHEHSLCARHQDALDEVSAHRWVSGSAAEIVV